MEAETIFWIVCLLLFMGLLVIKYRKYNVRRALNMPKNPPHYPDSAIRSAKAIGSFLYERANKSGTYIMFCTEGTGLSYKNLRKLADGKDYGVINLIRMAHYLGCEVVIRQMGTQDTENPATTPQVFAQYIANLEEEELRQHGIL